MEETMGTANFGLVGLDWQQRVNWERLREYRIERARQMMKKHGLGAMLCMYDENVRYITGTLTPGWNRLKPGLRHAVCRRPPGAVRAGRHRLPDRAPQPVDSEGERAALLCLDQRRSRPGLAPAGAEVHAGGATGDARQRRRRAEARR